MLLLNQEFFFLFSKQIEIYSNNNSLKKSTFKEAPNYKIFKKRTSLLLYSIIIIIMIIIIIIMIIIPKKKLNYILAVRMNRKYVTKKNV